MGGADRVIRLLATAALALAVAACSDPKFDESSQVGPNPALPATQRPAPVPRCKTTARHGPRQFW